MLRMKSSYIEPSTATGSTILHICFFYPQQKTRPNNVNSAKKKGRRCANFSTPTFQGLLEDGGHAEKKNRKQRGAPLFLTTCISPSLCTNFDEDGDSRGHERFA